MPITWRSLADTLNPQPVAFAVIRKLLKWRLYAAQRPTVRALSLQCFVVYLFHVIRGGGRLQGIQIKQNVATI